MATREDELDEFLEALDTLDELLDGLLCRDSEPTPDRHPRRIRERLTRMSRGLLEVDTAELEQLELEREHRRELERQAQAERQRILDACVHDFAPVDGGIDVCKLCRTWRPTPPLEPVVDDGLCPWEPP